MHTAADWAVRTLTPDRRSTAGSKRSRNLGHMGHVNQVQPNERSRPHQQPSCNPFCQPSTKVQRRQLPQDNILLSPLHRHSHASHQHTECKQMRRMEEVAASIPPSEPAVPGQQQIQSGSSPIEVKQRLSRALFELNVKLASCKSGALVQASIGGLALGSELFITSQQQLENPCLQEGSIVALTAPNTCRYGCQMFWLTAVWC